MKIEFKEESNKLIITKTSFEELSKLKKKMKCTAPKILDS